MDQNEALAWGALCALLALASLRLQPMRFLGALVLTLALLLWSGGSFGGSLGGSLGSIGGDRVVGPVWDARAAASARVAETEHEVTHSRRNHSLGPRSRESHARLLRTVQDELFQR